MASVRAWNAAHVRRLMIARQVDPRIEALLARHLKPGQLWLDIGCGTGLIARRMVDMGAEVVAFDSSLAALGRARELRPPDPALLYVNQDATRPWALAAGAFDGAVDMRSLENLTTGECEHAWRELWTALKPGGMLIAVMAHPNRTDDVTECGRVCKWTATALGRFFLEQLRADGFRCQPSTVYERGIRVDDWIMEARK